MSRCILYLLVYYSICSSVLLYERNVLLYERNVLLYKRNVSVRISQCISAYVQLSLAPAMLTHASVYTVSPTAFAARLALLFSAVCRPALLFFSQRQAARAFRCSPQHIFIQPMATVQQSHIYNQESN